MTLAVSLWLPLTLVTMFLVPWELLGPSPGLPGWATNGGLAGHCCRKAPVGPSDSRTRLARLRGATRAGDRTKPPRGLWWPAPAAPSPPPSLLTEVSPSGQQPPAQRKERGRAATRAPGWPGKGLGQSAPSRPRQESEHEQLVWELGDP